MNSNKKGDQSSIGPYSIIEKALKLKKKILISCNNNIKYYGFIRSFDRHCNMLLEDVIAVWKENNVKANELEKSYEKYYPKIFLRGDSIIVVSLV